MLFCRANVLGWDAHKNTAGYRWVCSWISMTCQLFDKSIACCCFTLFLHSDRKQLNTPECCTFLWIFGVFYWHFDGWNLLSCPVERFALLDRYFQEPVNQYSVPLSIIHSTRHIFALGRECQTFLGFRLWCILMLMPCFPTVRINAMCLQKEVESQ